MTIVGEVTLPVRPGVSGFQAELVAATDKAAVAAGRSAGRLFAAEFAVASRGGRGLSSAFVTAGSEAGVAGRRAGRVYATGFSEAAKAGNLATALPGGKGAAARAEASGLAAGRAYSRGMAVGANATSAFPASINRASHAAAQVAEREGGRAGRLFGTTFGKSSTPLIAAVVVAAASAKVAGDFQQDTNVLVTAAKELPENLAIVRKGILDTAVETGTQIKLVTDATYDAEKAGFRGAEANKVVRAAAQAAREENAKLSVVTAGLTTTMYNYGGNAVQTANALKTASAVSKTTFEQFSAGLGSFESRAKAAKIALPDVLGVYAAITQTGVPAQRAAQNLGQTIQQLSNPTQTMIDAFGRYNISVTDFTDKLGSGPGKRGLSGSLEYLNEQIVGQLGPSNKVLINTFNQSKIAAHAAEVEFSALPPAAQRIAKGYKEGTESLQAFRKDSGKLPGTMGLLARSWQQTYNKANDFQALIKRGGPEAQPYLAAMRQLLGGQQAVSVALAATGNSYEQTKRSVDSIADSYNHAGTEVEGWKSTQKLFNVQFDSFKQSVARAGIEIGTQLLPVLTKFFGFFSDHPDFAKAAIEGLLLLGGVAVIGKIGGLISTLGRLTGVIRGVGAAATVTAGETAAVGTAGAAAGAGRAGAAGAAARAAGAGTAARFSPMKLVIPVAVSYAAFKVLGLDKAIKPLLKGDVEQVIANSPGWIKAIGDKFNGGASKIAPEPFAGQAFSASVLQQQAKDAQARYQSAMDQVGTLNAAGRGGSPLAKQLEAQLPELKEAATKLGTEARDAQIKAFYDATAADRAQKTFDSIFHHNKKSVAETLFGSKDKKSSPSAPSDPYAAQNARDAADAQLATAGTTTSVKALTDQYHLSARAARDLADSNYSYTQTLAGEKDTLSATVKTLHGGTQEAQNNRLAISGVALAVQQHASAVRASTGSQEAGNEVFRAGIKTIQDQAVALGYSGSEVNKYVAEVLGIPESKLTEILNTSTTAKAQVDAYLQSQARIVDKSITITANTGAAAANLGAILGSINQLQDRTVTILVETINRTINEGISIGGAKYDVHARGGLVGHADGGMIRGPGTTTSDSILGIDRRTGVPTTWVSDEEYVVNAKATKKNLPLLEAINATGLALGGAVGRLAGGGLASGGKAPAPLVPGTLLTEKQSIAAYLRNQAKQVTDYLKALAKEQAKIAKIGVQTVQKTVTGGIKAGQAQITAAIKQGNGPLQKAVAAQLKTAQGRLYVTGMNAVRDNVVSPAEKKAVDAAAKSVTDLTARLTKLNTVNQTVKDGITSFIQAQQDYRNGLRDTLTDGNTLTDALALSGSARDVRASLGEKLATLRAFTKKIVALKKAGYSDVVVREIAQDGLDNGVLYADELLRGSKGDVTGINQAYADLQNAQSKSSAAISLLTQPNAPGITSRAAQAEINQAIYTKGVNTDRAAARAEYDQRTGVTVIQNNSYNGVDLKTAQAVTARDLALALKGAGVAGG